MMYPVSVVLSVLFACTGTISGKPSLDPHQLELKQHYEHLAYIADFPCHDPQPKVIPVHKLFSHDQAHGKAYFPDVTVLFRCDECTGTCTAGHICTPLHKDTVLLPFKATYLEDIGHHKKGSWNMEYHELLNHTECACATIPPPEVCHSNILDSEHPVKKEDHDFIKPSYSSSPSESGSGSESASSSRPDDEFIRVTPSTTERESIDQSSSTTSSSDVDLSSYFSSGN